MELSIVFLISELYICEIDSADVTTGAKSGVVLTPQMAQQEMEKILEAIKASKGDTTNAIRAVKYDIDASKEGMTAAIAASREETNAAISVVKEDVAAIKVDITADK